MSPSRVAYIVNVFPKISETFIAGELAELRKRGVQLRILSLRHPAEELRHDIVEQFDLVSCTVYDSRDFTTAIRDFRPELIHAHFALEATAMAREMAVQFRVPFTFTAHGYDIRRKPPADFRERAAAAGAVITVSEANARHIVETFGVPAAHIHVIPCGIDTDLFRPQRPATSLHIVCVARLVPVKNLRLLLETCAILQSRGVNFRCVLIGDGSCRDELAEARAQLELTDMVDMVGAARQAGVLSWWHRAAVAVLTSENEGMPVSLMEAAACGVPSVATAVGGIPELVEDGVTGLLTPPGDAMALANSLERLLHDPQLAAHMGAAARRRVVKRFSITRQVDCLLTLWRTLIHGEEWERPGH